MFYYHMKHTDSLLDAYISLFIIGDVWRKLKLNESERQKLGTYKVLSAGAACKEAIY